MTENSQYCLAKKKTLIVWTFWSWIPWICESEMEVPTFAWMYIVIGACILWLSQNNMFWDCPITDHVLDTTSYVFLALSQNVILHWQLYTLICQLVHVCTIFETINYPFIVLQWLVMLLFIGSLHNPWRKFIFVKTFK